MYHGWDEATAVAYARTTLGARLGMCDTIRFAAVQWGLMPAFVPTSPTFVPADAQAECACCRGWGLGCFGVACCAHRESPMCVSLCV